VRSFKSDLKLGQDAEAAFALKHNLTQTSGRKGDLLTASGKLVELKTDTYCPIKWKNFILERYSYDNKAGGPWQAKENKCDFFAYRFSKTDETYLFDVDTLLYRLDEILKTGEYELEDKHNRNHVTRFYRIPRALFLDINLSLEVLNDKT